MIVHEDGIVVKRIIDHDVENHTITIHSLNDMYPDRVIDLCDVKQIFNVIESVRQEGDNQNAQKEIFNINLPNFGKIIIPQSGFALIFKL